MAWQDLLDGIGESEESGVSTPQKKKKTVVTPPAPPQPPQTPQVQLPTSKRIAAQVAMPTFGDVKDTSDPTLRGLRTKRDVADESMSASVGNLAGLQQEKADYANAPVKKVPAWKRALYGAVENIGKQNPNSDWGTILGAGIGGAAGEGASQTAFAQRVTKNRSAEAEQLFNPKIANAEGQVKTASIISSVAAQKQREYEAQLAADTAEQHRQNEFKLRQQQEERLGNYQRATIDNARQKTSDIKEQQGVSNKFREEELRLKKEALENTKTYQNDRLEQTAQLQRERLANQNIQFTKIQVPNRKADGSIEYVDVPVPTNVEDVHEYLKGIYGETSPITRSVKPGAKAGVKKSVSNQTNNQTKFRFGG